MNKLITILQLFKQGFAVSDPKKWKERQITVTVLAAFIVALIQVLLVFGVSVPIDVDTANAIAAAVIGVVNIVLTLTTSSTVGLPSKIEYPEIKPQVTTEQPSINKKETVVRPEDNIFIN